MAKWMSVAQVKEKIKESSAEEVTAHYLETIGKSKINGYITVSDKALEQAKRIDSEGHNGPLAGVPIAIKDNISVAGLPNSCGSKILEGYVPPFNAHVIEKLLEAGAVILGKTNMDEFAMGSSTETSYYGPTANPWDLERVPGGSSGGSTAVVAAGEAPFALGSDTGGSIRCPAAFCGVVGLKPTYGAVSRHGVVAYANSLEQIGPIANNVTDIAVLMDVIAGYDHRDSTSIDCEIEYQKALVDNVKGLKIGVPKEFLGEGTHPDIEKAVWNAIHKFESLGATWEEVSMPNIKYALASYYIIAMSEASSNLARFDGTRYGFRGSGENWHAMVSKTRAEGFGKEVKRRILLGTYALSAGYHDKYYLKALKVRTLVKQDFDSVSSKFDVLMAPTTPNPAFKIGEKIEDPLTLYLSDVNTCPINLAGVPSISVPCGFTDGLPIGLQIIGRPFDEPTVLRAAYTFEQNTDYHTKRPPEVA
ncbi:MAG: Asp-tRNA(Asn)/Glu-tRNA(Gln) amidotransferase subunit GatA [Methanosarcina flavescens]|jgi:aspartyl-tRNA(Asn)/glutamyl-tRNA(Gln) amidotransferase subunit A|uniref:Glutamyl-tRNA(Gln) amidotransferase subunit A n=1 Tax=Methanosarcina flavescens TaxID=1715806 RepID=A0A660HS10_9EURY|nr:Asp-tRNA(Asn)/Glu-tRNA(Gln) amidotransferase subunit GatA [Methanosarcina flavescens]AYK15048.1 Asp-tRNA(Asn)/Glu-tRNA(Gln) amidotransferase subunit GatA [Methanosarcina flavescens]NLK31542.1 Asp-tRNA(Asn)/Glu-tRNA(Gln) amidotransferase subunit GatA [Methanosarcina flavescens]